MQIKKSLRPLRVFSESLKRKVVSDIESGKVNVATVSREFNVSQQSVYNWLNKYSRHLHSSTKIVIEMESEETKEKRWNVAKKSWKQPLDASSWKLTS